MPAISQLKPFAQAMRVLQQRKTLPSALSSAEQRDQFGKGFGRMMNTSARTTVEGVLEEYGDGLARIVNPTTEQRADRITSENPEGNVTVGTDAATVRLKVKELLQEKGYSPSAADRGTIKDLSSNARINLKIQTDMDIVQGAGQFVQSQDEQVIVAFPAWELFRLEERRQRRDWPTRFRLCAQIVGDVDAFRVLGETGRMIALKDSAIWRALGDGEDGSDDALGNPFPPFAFGSGMGVRDIAYSVCISLGLMKRGQRVTPNLPADLAQLFKEAA